MNTWVMTAAKSICTDAEHNLLPIENQTSH